MYDLISHANLQGFAAFFSVFAVFGFAYLNVRKRALKTRLVALGIAGVLALPALSFTVYYFHVLPETAWFYELRSWSGSEYVMVMVGPLMAVAASFFRRWMMPLWLAVMGGIVMAPFAKPLLGPLPESAVRDEWQGRVCMQSTFSTCGPASVTTILRLLGDAKATEREAARACYSYLGGTEAWYLARYVRSRGMRASFDFREGFAPDIQTPAVAGVKIGPAGHFIALLGREGDAFITADPLMGERRYSESDLKKRYDFTGFYLLISKE